jgi:hypothetical protein
MLKTIILVSGYSRSGKSTTNRLFRSLGVPTFSTSELLDQILDKLSVKLNNYIPSVEESEANIDYKEIRREKKIWLAEEILVPHIGRESFVYAIMRKVSETTENIIAIESIGGEEGKLFEDYCIHEKFRVIKVNIRSSKEVAGNDIRKLFNNAITIENASTIVQLEKKLFKLITMLEIDFISNFQSKSDLTYLETRVNNHLKVEF